jgi:hypothetical protein
MEKDASDKAATEREIAAQVIVPLLQSVHALMDYRWPR